MRAPNRTVRTALATAAGMALAIGGLAPVAQAAVFTPDATACVDNAGTRTCTFDLWAQASASIPLNGTKSAVFWSYTLAASGAADAVGPTLVVQKGDAVDITLHNALPDTSVSDHTSLAIPQLNNFPQDFVGAPNAGTAHYTFTANQSGTFLYEAGPTEDAPRQVAMGMVGAFVVLEPPPTVPTDPSTAYGTAASNYNDEAVVLMTEVDAGLHANPVGFDMRLFKPQFRMINGQLHPNIDRIAASPGNKLLLRIVNGGVQEHALGVLGTRQHVVAKSGRPLDYGYDVVSELVAPGDTMDTIIDLPNTQGALYPLYEPEGRLDNGGERAGNGTVLTGGMITLIDTGMGTGGGNTAPQATVTIDPPKRVNSGTNDAITFDTTITDPDGDNVTAAEFTIDNPTALPGDPAAIPLTVDAPYGPTLTINNVTVSTTGLSFGTHTIYVRGKDALDQWGSFAAATFTIDNRGPIVSSMSLNGVVSSALDHFATNGSQPLTVAASATEQGSGSGTVQSGAIDVDPLAAGGTSSMTVSPTGGALNVGLQGTISPTDLGALSEGAHTVQVTATDDLGNIGAPASQVFLVDTTKPLVNSVSATPTPNNGQIGTTFEVNADVSDPLSGLDAGSGVVSGQGWLGTPSGAGFPMYLTAVHGTTLRATLPLSQLTAYPDGNLTITVQAQDVAGNQSVVTTGTLRLDRQAPAVTLNAPTTGTGTVTVTGTATDSGLGVTQVVAAECYADTDPGKGAGTALTVTTPAASVPLSCTLPTTGWSTGNHTVYVRAKDAAGNWTAPSASVNVTIGTGLAIFSDTFEGTTIVPPWSSQTKNNGGTLTLTTTSGLVGKSLLVGLGGNARAYVTDTRPAAETGYSAQFRLRTGTLTTGTRTIDVFTARNSAGADTYRVQLRTDLGVQQMRVLVLRAGGSTASSWINVPTTSDVLVTVSWRSAVSATVTLNVGANTTSVTGVDTTAYRIDTVRLGASAGTGSGVSGSLMYDAFVSARLP